MKIDTTKRSFLSLCLDRLRKTGNPVLVEGIRDRQVQQYVHAQFPGMQISTHRVLVIDSKAGTVQKALRITLK